jgi:predicted nucleic acid-binding protein
VRVVFDTNVLVDYLRGIDDARVELERHREWTVSLVTWMALLIGAHHEEEEAIIRAFLVRFEVADVDRRTAEEAVRLRRARRG